MAVPVPGTRQSAGSFRLIVAATTVLLIASVLVAISVGAVSLPLSQVWRILMAQLSDGVETGASAVQERIVWQFRVPRALLGVVVGAPRSRWWGWCCKPRSATPWRIRSSSE